MIRVVSPDAKGRLPPAVDTSPMDVALRLDAEGIPATSRWLRSEATTPPDARVEMIRIPEGCQPDSASVQKPIFVFQARLLQKLHQLLPKRLHAMMIGLVRDVFLHLRPHRRAHGEGTVAFLPPKLPQLDLLMHPHGRSLLQFPHEVGEAMHGLQAHKQMHVISNTAHALNKPAKSADRAAEVFVQTFTPRGVDQRDAVFGGKHDVLMPREKCRWNGGAWLLASLRDARCFAILSGGVASLNHRLIAMMPPASSSQSSILLSLLQNPEFIQICDGWLT